MAKNDTVNHPSHYAGKVETIEYIIQSLGLGGTVDYCKGNIIKYISRYKKKNGLEDLKKAQWYLNKIISMREISVDESLEPHLIETYNYIEDKQNKDGVQGFYTGSIFISLAGSCRDIDYIYADIYLSRLISYLENDGRDNGDTGNAKV